MTVVPAYTDSNNGKVETKQDCQRPEELHSMLDKYRPPRFPCAYMALLLKQKASKEESPGSGVPKKQEYEAPVHVTRENLGAALA